MSDSRTMLLALLEAYGKAYHLAATAGTIFGKSQQERIDERDCAMQALLTAIEDEAQLSELHDAQRWRALMRCRRVRLLGYARGGPRGDEGPIRHIGFEFTTDEPDFEGRGAEKTLAVATLIEFVDAQELTR